MHAPLPCRSLLERSEPYACCVPTPPACVTHAHLPCRPLLDQSLLMRAEECHGCVSLGAQSDELRRLACAHRESHAADARAIRHAADTCAIRHAADACAIRHAADACAISLLLPSLPPARMGRLLGLPPPFAPLPFPPPSLPLLPSLPSLPLCPRSLARTGAANTWLDLFQRRHIKIRLALRL